MSEVSITKAAKLADVSRTTLYNDMDSGKLSYNQTGKNKRTINVAELERVYGSLNIETEKVSTSVKSEQNNFTGGQTELVELAILRERVAKLTEQNEKGEETIEYLKGALDKAQSNAQRLLEDQSEGESKSSNWEKLIEKQQESFANQLREITEQNDKNTQEAITKALEEQERKRQEALEKRREAIRKKKEEERRMKEEEEKNKGLFKKLFSRGG